MLLASGWALPAWGQSDELMEAYNRQNELREQGRYAEAIPFAEKALELGEDEFGPERSVTAATLNHLADLHYAQGRNAEAEPLDVNGLDALAIAGSGTDRGVDVWVRAMLAVQRDEFGATDGVFLWVAHAADPALEQPVQAMMQSLRAERPPPPPEAE